MMKTVLGLYATRFPIARWSHRVQRNRLYKSGSGDGGRQKTISLLAERYHLMKQELAKVKTEILQRTRFRAVFLFINLAPEAGLKATEVCDLLKQYQVGLPLSVKLRDSAGFAVWNPMIFGACQSLEQRDDLKSGSVDSVSG